MATRRRDPIVVFLFVVAALVAGLLGVLAVVGGDAEEDAVEATTTTATTLPPDPAVTCPGADGRSQELRRCLEQSMAFIETDLASGSGVLLPGGHIVTNAHVVDPFDEVDVIFPGGERHEAVHVVGIDAFADIAVLAPVDTDRPGVTFSRREDVDFDEEPEVFLVGYPGGVEGDDPRVTLASGILSRLRQSETFGLTYLQTDAAIAGGQSGGALVDAEGRVLGISGLSFAQEFALALTVDDVLVSMERIFAEGGDERRVVPAADALSFPVRLDLPSYSSHGIWILPAMPEPRTVQLSVDTNARVGIEVTTASGDYLGMNEEEAEVVYGFVEEGGIETFPDFVAEELLDEVAPDTWAVEVPADEIVLVTSHFVDRVVGVMNVDVDGPFTAFTNVPTVQGLQLGHPVLVVSDGLFSTYQVFEIELAQGAEVEISVRSTHADPFFTVVGPDEELDLYGEVTADDGGGGLYDLDAVAEYTAEVGGRYTIAVGTYDGVVAGYQVMVRPAE